MSMDKFDKYVEKMHEDRDKLFEIEYEVNNFVIGCSLSRIVITIIQT